MGWDSRYGTAPRVKSSEAPWSWSKPTADGRTLRFWDQRAPTATRPDGGAVEVTDAFGVYLRGTGHRGLPRRVAMLVSDMAFMYDRDEIPDLIRCAKKFATGSDPQAYRETAVRRCMMGETRRMTPAGGQRMVEHWRKEGR